MHILRDGITHHGEWSFLAAHTFCLHVMQVARYHKDAPHRRILKCWLNLRILQIATGGRTAAVGHGAVLCGRLLAAQQHAQRLRRTLVVPQLCLAVACGFPDLHVRCVGGRAVASTCKQSAKYKCYA